MASLGSGAVCPFFNCEQPCDNSHDVFEYCSDGTHGRRGACVHMDGRAHTCLRGVGVRVCVCVRLWSVVCDGLLAALRKHHPLATGGLAC